MDKGPVLMVVSVSMQKVLDIVSGQDLREALIGICLVGRLAGQQGWIGKTIRQKCLGQVVQRVRCVLTERPGITRQGGRVGVTGSMRVEAEQSIIWYII